MGRKGPYRFVHGWVAAATATTFALEEPVAAPTTSDVLLCDVRAGGCRAAPSGTPMT